DDESPRTFGADLLGKLLEAGPLIPLVDLAGDPDMVREGHVHQEPPRQGDLRRHPGALRADRLLGDLNEDLVPLLQLLLDRGVLRRTAAPPIPRSALLLTVAVAISRIGGAVIVFVE